MGKTAPDETPAQILARLLSRPTPKAKASTKTAGQARKSVPVLEPARVFKGGLVRVPDVPDKISVALACEMVLQELERGGYGGIELRDTGRTVADLAAAASLPVPVAFLALRELQSKNLARFQPTRYRPSVQSWVPVRAVEDSPYTFNTNERGTYEPPERLDFFQALRDEKARKAGSYASAIVAAAYAKSVACVDKPKRGRGRPRKTPSWLRGMKAS